MLFALASAFGTPLKVDEPTSNLTRPSVARVLVEVDVSRTYKERIWIGNEKEGFFQRVIFENMPKYCNYCYKMGHSLEECHVKIPNLKEAQSSKNENKSNKVPQPKKTTILEENPEPKKVTQRYVAKISDISADKGKMAQCVSTPMKEDKTIEAGPSKTTSQQEFEKGSDAEEVMDIETNIPPKTSQPITMNESKQELPVAGEVNAQKGLTCVFNSEINSIPSNDSGSPGNINSEGQSDKQLPNIVCPDSVSQQGGRDTSIICRSVPSSPRDRSLALCRFAHTEEESGEEEAEEDEEEDDPFDKDYDYPCHARDYDFYAYNPSRKGLRIGRLMGNSRR